MSGLPPRADRAPLTRRSGALFSLDAADVPTLTPRSGQVLTFVRATPATAIGGSGRITQAVHSQARLHADRNATTGLYAPSLLMEPAGTNLILRSQEFDNAVWTKTTATVAANAVTAPDGTLTADKLQEDNTTAQHLAAQGVTIIAGNHVSASVFFKSAERSRILVQVFNGGDAIKIVARADLGTFTTSVTGAGAVTDGGLQSLGNSWWRAWVTGKVNAASTAMTMQSYLLNASDASTYLGVTGAGLYLWGADLKAGDANGSLITSHIPSVAATVARNADRLTLTPAWSFQDTLTIYAKIARPLWAGHTAHLGAAGYIVSWGTTAPRLELLLRNDSRTIGAQLYDGTTAVTVTPAAPAGDPIEVCAQFTGITTGGKVRLDVGSGFGAYSGLTGPISAFGAVNTLAIGDGAHAAGVGLATGLRRVLVLPGERSMAECRGAW